MDGSRICVFSVIHALLGGTEIYDGTFSGFACLEEVIFPEGITKTGKRAAADINGDGVTVNDALSIQEFLLGKSKTLA